MPNNIWRSISERMFDLDMFGHVINLNFDRKGDSHKTFIGAGCSFFIKIGMCVYITSICMKLMFRLDDKIIT